MLRRLVKEQRGFTLMELMMVIAILGILVAIIAPAVSGTSNFATEGQVSGDGQATQSAVDSYNNKSTQSNQWPENAFGAAYKDPASVNVAGDIIGGARVYKNKDGVTASVSSTTHSEVNFLATTSVWQDDGTVDQLTFVPDFLLKMPESAIAQNDEGLNDATNAKLFEFLWLMQKNAVGSETESRTVQVYRLTGSSTSTAGVATATYEQIY